MYPGIDIIEISRFDSACQRHPRLIERLFTPKELDAVKGQNSASLAVRFAGKEAVLKALGTGLRGLSWHDVEIISNEYGEPSVYLSERALRIAQSRGAQNVRISLSHSRENAVAMVVLF